MIHVVAIITAQPGKREAVLAEFRAIIPTVHAEEGCIEYAPAIDVPGVGDAFGPDTFVVVEKWASAEALAAHAGAPHMRAYGERVSHLLAGRAVHVLQPC